MRSHLSLLLLLFFAATIVSCVQPIEEPVEEPTTTEVAVDAINKLAEEYTAAVNDGNTASLIGLFTDDGVLMPPNEPAISGNQMIESWYQARFAQTSVEQSTFQAEAEAAASWAFARGDYRVKLTPKENGEPSEEDGKYILISRQQPDGSWKIARLMWSNNNPPPEQ